MMLIYIMGNLILGFTYFIFIGLIVLFVGIYFILKFKKKQTNITKILAIFNGFYVISFVFSIISFYHLRIADEPLFEPGTYLYIIVVENIGYYFFIFMANYVFYRFYLEIFSSKDEENKKFTQFYIFFYYNWCNINFDSDDWI